jgi:hypothetical protein
MFGRIRSPRLKAALAAALGALALIAPAFAQVSPDMMVSGTRRELQVGPVVSDYTVYSVPPGHRLVLTDVTWSPVHWSMDIAENLGNAELTILDGGLTERWAWATMVYQYYGESGATVDHEWPIEKSWTTGLVFQDGDNVIVRSDLQTTGGGFLSVEWQLSWSGYLVPMSSAGIPGSDWQQLRAELRLTPNPATERSTIHFQLTDDQDLALLAVYDVQGRVVRTLHLGPLAAGEHTIDWDGRDDQGFDVVDGVYFARLETPAGSESERFLRLR